MHYHYDQDSRLMGESLANGTVLREYVYLRGEPVALLEYETRAGWYFYVTDHLGTPQQLVDAQGTVVWQAAYLPYGEAQILTASVQNNLHFPGQHFDAETGLHYNWNRYYNPKTGRYITADPIGIAGGMNLYAYVGGNPVNALDVEGLDYLEYYHQTGQLVWVFETGIGDGYSFETGRKYWPANSGYLLFQPIPTGTYYTSPQDKEYHPGEEQHWGPFSYRLHEGIFTRIFNRYAGRDGGFHIHGGVDIGTAGCIEFSEYSENQTYLYEFDKLIQNYGRRIALYVK